VEFEINDLAPAPGYLQLANQLREKIQSGEITDRLPSLKQLCDASGLSLSSVQHTVKVLKGEGLVVSVKGRGTFIQRDGAQP
jgi:DNA-binding GntR family transcriptional regulator